jgi:hypothetical protein
MNKMCLLISRYWKDTKNLIKTPEEIFKMNPHGELFEIAEWYHEAKHYYKTGKIKKFGIGDIMLKNRGKHE